MLCLPFTSKRCDKVAQQIISCIKKATPDYHLNICWRNVKLSEHHSPKLKLAVPKLEKNGCVYQFQCKCSHTQIGETKRQLKARLAEHNRRRTKSAIYDHISECQPYNLSLSEIHGESPTRNQRFSFLDSHVTILASGIVNYHDRTNLEAVMITILKPKLNEQVFHKNVSIV